MNQPSPTIIRSLLGVEAGGAGAAARPKLPADRWTLPEILFWLAVLGSYWVFPTHLMLLSQILIVGLFALSLDMIMGYAGIVSLGQAAYFGTGAYAAGLLAQAGWGDPLLGLVVGGAAGTLLGFVVSPMVARGNDLTRLMVTMGIGLLCFEAANKAAFVTGGVDGLSGVTMAPVLGLFDFDLFGRTAFFYSLAVVFLAVVLCRRLLTSPFGLALQGIREGAKRMPSLGAPVRRHLIAVYAFAAGVAGIAGALLAQTTQFVGLESLSFNRSAELLIMLVLGGSGRLYGGLVGAAVFMVAQDTLAGLNPVYWQFWLGLMLMAVVMFARGGLLGGAATLLRRLETRRSA